MGVLGPDHDGRRRTVGHPGAVHHRESPGHRGHLAHLLGRDLPSELGQVVAGPVGVVLLGDPGRRVAQLVLVHAVALGVGGQN